MIRLIAEYLYKEEMYKHLRNSRNLWKNIIAHRLRRPRRSVFYLTIAFAIVFTSCSQQSSTDNSTMEHHQTIETYYQSYKVADRETLRSLLTDDFHHISEFSEFGSPDEMLDTIWPEVGKSWAEDLQIFDEHPEFLVRYKVVGGEQPSRNMVEYIRFEGEKIAEIEVFTGREIEG